jgi:hypothetical protein
MTLKYADVDYWIGALEASLVRRAVADLTSRLGP